MPRPGKFLLGNLLDIPPYHSWLKFKEWADEYGPIYRLNLGGSEHVVVSTEKVANDLLRERGTIYSSRAQAPAAAQLLSDNLRPLLLPYNDVWRRIRRLMHHMTMASAATRYEPTQILESSRLLYDLVRDPARYETYLERYASGLIFRLAFGKVLSDQDAIAKAGTLDRILAVVHNVERVASPGAYLVDVFPSLMMLPEPLAPFKKELKALHQNELGLFRELLEDVKGSMEKGTAPDCWERTFLEKQEEYGLTKDEGAYAVGTLYEAGSGTTAAAMMSFLLAMVLHPQWQTKLQEELDRVVGNKKLPDFEDLPNLPLVRAVAKEVLRWRPVTAGGVPHQLVKDDVYEGMFLKAGTLVHANQWLAIHRDPELYPHPETFLPSRWLDPSFPTYKEPLTLHPNLQNYSCFGFGRRICPGQNIAERSMFLLISRIAWSCTVRKTKDGLGKEIDVPPYDYTAGFNVQPKWFPFDLVVRDKAKMDLVDKAYTEAKRGDPLGGNW
ncbi:cytochrome P450 [Lineolata rhizophorae]|uniref:Cytochrome P450 n=1 Tax=Lineolata rhizophorae TaxID=578093 RepID=A0A6A6NQ06_9PEZI|nr:cytochrome P450 [Lineolata rhizophorae]